VLEQLDLIYGNQQGQTGSLFAQQGATGIAASQQSPAALAAAHYTAKGIFIRFRLKFDQDTVREMADTMF
jgi:hypothetical protein